ncbi:hypothetical protein NDU88_001666 [Pleurodeles waltl]|uniref:Uncharacterized protein n=1 Tax=Pleurodeles waltl TaxID=8319 RepID=A0AAV7T071_PLEWA|nr:hypothetical protein NDU88_001666 [Pleurodeles waltl]
MPLTGRAVVIRSCCSCGKSRTEQQYHKRLELTRGTRLAAPAEDEGHSGAFHQLMILQDVEEKDEAEDSPSFSAKVAEPRTMHHCPGQRRWLSGPPLADATTSPDYP